MVPRFRPALLALLATAALAACGERTGPGSEVPGLQSARERWVTRGPATYAMVLSRSCECLPEMSGPVAISVRDGVVASREYTRTGQPVDPRYAELFPDIPGLFGLIEDASQRGAVWLEVNYHPALGYPLKTVIDFDGMWGNDDEFIYTISAFEPH